MSDLLSNPIVLLIAGVVGFVILALLFFLLRSRWTGQKGEGQIREELTAMERENQIAVASSQVAFSNSPEYIAAQMAAIFRELLSIQLFKIYGGRDGDEHFFNVLPKDAESLITNELSQAASLPAQIPAQAALNYTWAQNANTKALIGEVGMGEGEAITVIPWRGPFGWSGLMVANPLPSPPNDLLSRLREPINLMTSKLAVALELTNPQSGAAAQSEASTLNHFYETLLQSTEDQNAYQTILQEVTKVSGANSAALWRLDSAAQVLKMESAYGLQAAEFLPQPIGQGLAGTVLDTRTPLALEDAPSDPRCLFPQEARESGVGSYLGIPLMANGNPLGVLEVHTLQPKWWDEQDLNKLEAIAQPLSKFIQKNSKLSHTLQAENAYLGLSEALQLLRTSDDLMSAVVEVIGHALGVSRVAIIDLTKEPATIRHEFKTNDTGSSLGSSLSESALQRIRKSLSQDEGHLRADSPAQSLLGQGLAESLGVSAELAVPVKKNGQARALILLHQCGQSRNWTPVEIEFTERVGRQMALSLANLDATGNPPNLPSANGVEGNRGQTILNHLPDAVISLDKDGRVTFINNKAESWLGLTPGDLGGPATLTDALAMTDEYFWNRVVACKENSRFESYLKPDARPHAQSSSATANPTEKIPLSVSVAPLRNQNGAISGFLVSLCDVRHLKGGAGILSSQIAQLNEEKIRIEKSLADMKSAELQARARIEKLNSLTASGLNVNEEIRRLDAELAKERQRLKEQEMKSKQTFQQQVAINRLKNEFIVNTGGDIAANIQTLLKKVELLKSGALGQLNQSQQQAIDELLKVTRETHKTVTDFIDYGSSRSQ